MIKGNDNSVLEISKKKGEECTEGKCAQQGLFSEEKLSIKTDTDIFNSEPGSEKNIH